MDKIVNVEQAIQRCASWSAGGKHIVVVGGCFDILHVGHLVFLEKAKAQGDRLVVLVESDETIRKLKGAHRPINVQDHRARLLAALTMVDMVVLLPALLTNEAYDSILFGLKPAIIATTGGDPNRLHKERQAHAVGGRVVDVVLPVEDQSTSRIVKILEEI
jgi:rfaE bifunctional protein nucleotidyltransferase chain/domain